jgi:predicted nucleic acid-binding protein
MRRIIVNSTPIISLAGIDSLILLKKLYKEIIVPEAVYEEVSIEGESKIGAKRLKEADFIKIHSVDNKEAEKIFSTSLHKGEVEVLLLARELKADLVIIDDLLARKHAKYLDIKVTGTLGILLKAKKKGYLKKIKPLLDELINNNIYISDKLYKNVLDLANE